jgi:hypothetical protein
MSSNLLNSIGLGNLDIAYILIGFLVLIIVLFVISIISLVKQKKLKKKYDSFMLGKNAQSMEKEITELFSDIQYLKEGVDKNAKEVRHIYKRLETTYQKLGIVRYDAFQQMGGKLSFSLALLDENNDGFILNSVHSSDGCYSYTKEIKDGNCEISLGEEEQQALNIAMKE